jgi:hypothetical protein
MYTSLSYIICIARVFDDHRSCQKLINYITNIKAKSKRYHWIQKIPMTKQIRIILLILDFKLGTIDNREDYLQTWGEFFFFVIIIIISLDKNRNMGFSSRHLLRLQKFCINSCFRTGIFWIQ